MKHMKKKFALILVASILAALLPGCGDKTSVPDESTNSSVQNESSEMESSVNESSSEAENSVDESSSAAEASSGEISLETDSSDVSDGQGDLSVFESDLGYSISYEEENFNYRRTEGYDEFILKSDEADKPFVFVCVSHIDAELLDAVKAGALGDQPEACTIGQAQMQGECSETEEDWNGGKIIHKIYVCPLDSGDALLIETQRYTEQDEDPYAALLMEMVNSIKV